VLATQITQQFACGFDIYALNRSVSIALRLILPKPVHIVVTHITGNLISAMLISATFDDEFDSAWAIMATGFDQWTMFTITACHLPLHNKMSQGWSAMKGHLYLHQQMTSTAMYAGCRTGL